MEVIIETPQQLAYILNSSFKMDHQAANTFACTVFIFYEHLKIIGNAVYGYLDDFPEECIISNGQITELLNQRLKQLNTPPPQNNK